MTVPEIATALDLAPRTGMTGKAGATSLTWLSRLEAFCENKRSRLTRALSAIFREKLVLVPERQE